MRITTGFIRRVHKQLALSSNLKAQPLLLHKLPAFTPAYRPWKRAFGTAIGETEASGFKVDVRSREMIKPSSPTPDYNKTVTLSLIDQLASPVYIPMLFFYKNDTINNSNIQGKSVLLKKSLSETLVDFYPLAGRIQGNELVDCNDQGVEFCEAHTSEGLTNFLENNTRLGNLHALLPFQNHTPRHKNIVLSVQVNHFSCGGAAIGVCLHHKIADGVSTTDFLRAWAAKAQVDVDGRHPIFRPKFNGASFFPPVKELSSPMLVTEDQLNLESEEKIALVRLFFDKKAIDELKEQAIAAANSNTIRPTRVEVVTAFILKHWPNKFSSIVQTVNLRKRMAPPIPEDFFGNCAWFARTSEYRPEVIIQELRKGIEKVNGDHMKELLFSDNDNFMSRLDKEIGAVFEGPKELVMRNSLAGFPLYEVNFGMGRPVWACLAATPLKNVLLTMSTPCGQGIEAWVCMLEDDIAKLHHSLSQLPYPLVKPLEIN